MTDLQRRALARTPLTDVEIAAIYDRHTGVTRIVCESHERLRAELQGAEVMIRDGEVLAETLRAANLALAQRLQAASEALGRVAEREEVRGK